MIYIFLIIKLLNFILKIKDNNNLYFRNKLIFQKTINYNISFQDYINKKIYSFNSKILELR